MDRQVDPRTGFPVDARGMYSGPRPLHGTLIFVAVMSLIYGLVCGCIEGSVALPLRVVHGGGPEAEKVLRDAGEEWLKTIEQVSNRQAGGPGSGESLKSAAQILRDNQFPDRFAKAGSRALETPAGKRLGNLSLASVLTQLGFLVLGVLLFGRVRLARRFGLILALVAIGVKIFFALDLQEVIRTVGEELTPFFAELESKGVAPATGGTFGPSASGMSALGLVLFFVAAFVTAWPLIAFLCLLFSRGIKWSLGLVGDE